MTRKSVPRKPAGDQVAVRGGRKPPPKTEIFNWVALSGVSPNALALYNLLRMHVNREREDDLVWTGKLTLAVMMGLSRGDKIDPYLAELRAIMAVESELVGMPAHNEYTVHALPPKGYTGPVSLTDWYDRNRPRLELMREQEKRKRDQRRVRKATGAVAPDTGEQAVTPETGQHDTPETGQHVPPAGGQPVTPKRGRKPSRGFEPTGNESSPPPTGSSDKPPGWAVAPQPEEKEETSTDTGTPTPVAGPQLTPDEEELHRACMTIRETWSPSVLREVLADPSIRERPPALVRAAFLAAARTPKTLTPRRLLHDLCPHWHTAAAEVDPPIVPEQRRSDDWCGDASCDATTRQLLDGQGRPQFADVNGKRTPRWCPRCVSDGAALVPAGQP